MKLAPPRALAERQLHALTFLTLSRYQAASQERSASVAQER